MILVKLSGVAGGLLMVTFTLVVVASSQVVSTRPDVSQQQTSVSVPLPTGFPSGGCVVKGPDGEARQTSKTMAVMCPSGTSSVLSCDAPGVEPLDVSLEHLCGRPAPAAVPAEMVRVQTPARGPLLVRWISAMEGHVSLHATRTLTPTSEGVLELPVGSDDSRLVTFSVPEHAPITVTSHELRRGDFRLSAFSTLGGEAIVHVVPSAVSPVLFDVSSRGNSARNTMRYAGAGFYVGPILSAGIHAVTPRFAGNVSGRTSDLEVVQGESRVYFVPQEDIGGLRVVLAQGICDSTDQIVIAKTKSGGAMQAVEPTRRFRRESSCTVDVAGLTPGQYEVAPVIGENVQATVSAEVIRQTLSPVDVDGALVRLSGRLRMGATPVTGVSVEIDSHAKATTDDDGRFKLTLAKPGSVVARLRRPPDGAWLGHERTFEFVEGDNEIDWNLEGRVVEVTINNWDRRGDVELIYRLSGRFSASVRLARDAELPFVLQGLGFGTYLFDLRQIENNNGGRAKTAARQEVVIKPGVGDVRLSFDLEENSGILTVLDSRGQLAEGAEVIGFPAHPERVSIGTFSLARVAKNTEMWVIASGHVPTCVSASGGLTVRLEVGVPLAIVFDGPIPASQGALITGPGLGCGVPLRHFKPTPGTQEGVLILQHVPAGVLGLTWGNEATQRIDAAAGQPVRLRTPGGQ